MHLLACFPGRKMFVLRTCPVVFSSFCPNTFGWDCVRSGDEQRDRFVLLVGDENKLAAGFKILA